MAGDAEQPHGPRRRGEALAPLLAAQVPPGAQAAQQQSGQHEQRGRHHGVQVLSGLVELAHRSHVHGHVVEEEDDRADEDGDVPVVEGELALDRVPFDAAVLLLVHETLGLGDVLVRRHFVDTRRPIQADRLNHIT